MINSKKTEESGKTKAERALDGLSFSCGAVLQDGDIP